MMMTSETRKEQTWDELGEKLGAIYYNVDSPAGYSTKNKLWKQAKKEIPSLTLKQVSHWWATQSIPTRFALAKKKFPRAIFVTHKANYTWLGDLADFTKLSYFNKGFKWLLIVQDLFSRKLIALIALKNKTSKETAAALQGLFTLQSPSKFLTDKGGEFLGKCKEIYLQYNVHHYVTHDVTQKVAPVERALLVVKQRLFKIMAKEATWKWIDKLAAIVDVYNKSLNRNLGMSPNEAAEPINQSKVFYNTVTRHVNKRNIPFKFEVGQVVRILKDQTFSKSYTGNYSNVLYEIYEREKKSGVPVYFLKELLTSVKYTGSFYQQELKLVHVDKTKLPNIQAIHGTRLDRDQEQVLIDIPTGGRKWMNYEDLIPYKKV